MNRYVLVILALLFIVYVQHAAGQSALAGRVSAAAEKGRMTSLLGNPAYSASIDSVTIRVWVITQVKHRSVLKRKRGPGLFETRHGTGRPDSAIHHELMTGTHYFLYEVRNSISHADMPDSSAKLEIVSPSNQLASATLHPMKGHYGTGVTLHEHGHYLFTVSLNVGMGYRTTQFKTRIQ